MLTLRSPTTSRPLRSWQPNQSSLLYPSRGFISGMVRGVLSKQEALANDNPKSATAQTRFYETLMSVDLPQIVVERYQSGKYATDGNTEAVYQRALSALGNSSGSVMSGAGDNALLAGNMSSAMGTRTMSAEDIRAIGQAVAAHSQGQRIAYSSGRDGGVGSGDKKSPLYVVIEETIGASILRWFKFLLYFGLFSYFGLQALSLFVELFSVSKKLGSSNVTEAQAQHQTVRFTDVQGCEEAKDELSEVVEFLKSPDKFSALGGKLPKGVLLVGPPGTGKTLLARAVAGEAGVPFFFMSGSEFDEVYVGVGAKRVRELFATARAKSPSIIFIDELDAVGGKRSERDQSYSKQTLNQLLVDLDGFAQNSGVVLIAATNFPELLDKALTRPGRFDRRITVPLPDVRGRIQILEHHLKKVQAGTDIDVSVIARKTPGFSGAELENVVNQAAVHASRNKAKKVGMEDIEWAKDKIVMGPEVRSRVITDEDKLMTAYHEAGHALVAYFTDGAYPIYKITVLSRAESLGMTSFLPEMDQTNMNKKQLRAQIDVSMGGKLAEAMIYGDDNVTTGAASDLNQATRVARQMVCQMGMSEALGNVDLASDFSHTSPETRKIIDSEIRRMIDEGSARAEALLRDKADILERVARSLVEYETLTKEEFEQVVKGLPLDKAKVLPSPAVKITDGVKAVRPLGGIPAPASAQVTGGTG